LTTADPSPATITPKATIFTIFKSPFDGDDDNNPIISNARGVELPYAKQTIMVDSTLYIRNSPSIDNSSYGSFFNDPIRAFRAHACANPAFFPASSSFSGVHNGVCLGPLFVLSNI
jgi:hypothetical protein